MFLTDDNLLRDIRFHHQSTTKTNHCLNIIRNRFLTTHRLKSKYNKFGQCFANSSAAFVVIWTEIFFCCFDEIKFENLITYAHPSALKLVNFGADSARVRIPCSVIDMHHEISHDSKFKQLELNEKRISSCFFFYFAYKDFRFEQTKSFALLDRSSIDTMRYLLISNIDNVYSIEIKFYRRKKTILFFSFFNTVEKIYAFDSLSQCLRTICSTFGQFIVKIFICSSVIYLQFSMFNFFRNCPHR